MEFHPNTNKRKAIKYGYSLHSVILKKVSDAKYLAVTMNTRVSWKKHVREINGKADQTAQFLQRNLVAFKTKTKSRKKLCYETFIRSIVE